MHTKRHTCPSIGYRCTSLCIWFQHRGILSPVLPPSMIGCFLLIALNPMVRLSYSIAQYRRKVKRFRQMEQNSPTATVNPGNKATQSLPVKGSSHTIAVCSLTKVSGDKTTLVSIQARTNEILSHFPHKSFCSGWNEQSSFSKSRVPLSRTTTAA